MFCYVGVKHLATPAEDKKIKQQHNFLSEIIQIFVLKHLNKC